MNDKNVISYIPEQTGDKPAAEMGLVRRGLWVYVNQLGLDFSLVLLVSLGYQIFVAVLIALKSLKYVPIFDSLLRQASGWQQMVSYLAAIFVAIIIQAIIVLELAQVVWLYKPDKLKVRLMSGSAWWWVMLGTLLLTIPLDFSLLFLAVAEQPNLDAAWRYVVQNQATGFSVLLLSILNFLTILRCASVMRTSTTEENRRRVEEQLNAVAEEMLLDAGEATRTKAKQIWKELAVNPKQLVPVQNAVFNLLSQNHPELIPPQLGGESWAYDFGSNSFAALPPDVHMALLQNRQRGGNNPKPLSPNQRLTQRLGRVGQVAVENDPQVFWQLPSEHLAQTIGFNLQNNGKPHFVDATVPGQPQYLQKPLDRTALLGSPTEIGAGAEVTGWNSASPRDKVLFAAYLKPVFQQTFGQEFTSVAGADIFQMFDEQELAWHYRVWQKQGGQR